MLGDNKARRERLERMAELKDRMDGAKAVVDELKLIQAQLEKAVAASGRMQRMEMVGRVETNKTPVPVSRASTSKQRRASKFSTTMTPPNVT